MEKELLLELSEAYREAKIVITAASHDLFDFMEEYRRVEEVASKLNADERGLEILLNALAALGLVEKEGERYRNGREASLYLVSSSGNYIGHFLKHSNQGFERWAKLDRVVFGRNQEEDTEDFLLALDDIARERAREVAGAVNLEGKKSLVDLGGGSGAYSHAFSELYGVKATVLELPNTAKVTRKMLTKKGVQDISVREGDFMVDDLGEGYDAALLSNIVHFLSVEDNRNLFHRVHSSLVEGGLVIVHDYILEDSKVSPREGAIFSVHMYLSSPGRSYSWSELEGWLAEAGFSPVQRQRLTETGILVARKVNV